MKKHVTVIILYSILILFAVFIIISNRYSTVLNVDTPTKLEINSNNIKSKLKSETLCVSGVEAFSLAPDEKFFRKYSEKYNLSLSDMIGLGFLAQDYSQKLLQNKQITLKYTPKITKECKYAKVKLNGIEYSKLLANSGFGITKGKINNPEKFNQNLKNARKLNLVILNHHSGKYHRIDCPYGLAAHDSVILPYKQLPKDASPCKFCHRTEYEKVFAHKLKKDIDIIEIPKIPTPNLIFSDGNIKVINTDFTKVLKPNYRCTTKACTELKDFIDNTKSTLDIAIYGYEDNAEITSALNRAKSRGVAIRFVYDETFYPQDLHYKNNQLITDISEEFRSDKSLSSTTSNMIMHNKFIISDNKSVFTGSMNISSSGLSDFDVNNIVIINSKEISELYRKEFEQMLDGKFHQQKVAVGKGTKYSVGDSEIEIYFSPKNNSVQRITELIGQAREYIYMPTFLLTHRNISNALISAKKRGIDVRIIIDANGATTSHSKLKELRDNGILVKTENFAGKLHSKAIIIDDKYIITGSMNFSYSGAEKNDENSIIIKNPDLAKACKNFFLYLWTMIPNKYLKQNANPEGPESFGSCTDGVDNNFNGKIDREEKSCTGTN